MIPYGDGEQAVDVVGAFEEVGLEYAPIRKGCVLFDMPHAGTLIARGTERLDFLNNMVTQRVVDLTEGQSCDSFWLSRKGRVDADMRLSDRGDHTIMTLDRHLAKATAESLTNYVFSEDVTIEDCSETQHVMALHGVGALAVLAAAAENSALASLALFSNAACEIAGVSATAERDDLTGEPGVALRMAREDAETVYDALLQLRAGVPSVKAAGWFAINSARIEAGRPLYNMDFGSDSLPAETGVIDLRVDFKKGCYLGQEVVARMDARKARKRGVVAIRIAPDPETAETPLPSLGDRLYRVDDSSGDPIGAVTSSTISPMLSGASVAFATVRDKETKPGTELMVSAEGKRATATVQDNLVLWSRSG
ncbi:MAG: folate-binding protein YgfZ [Phycisphaerales bacterium]